MGTKQTRIHWRSLILVVTLVLIFQTALAQKAEDVYDAHKKMAEAQASEDPLIGIWSGSMCSKRILLAVIRNDEQNGYRLKAVLLNGKEVGYGFKNADAWFYVSPVALAGVYEGKTLYRNRFFKNWYPNRIVMSGDDAFTAVDDAKNSCGSAANVYVRRESRAMAETKQVTKLGSGFLLRQTAFVMTAYHVVDGANEIQVRFPSGDKYAAELIARDAANDLAILKLLDFKPSDDGFTISLPSVSPGDSIHALGFPLSDKLGNQPSIVSGQVSSTTGYNDSPTQFRMTTPINSGNSGGPILNQNGEVVGIAVASLVGRTIEGISFGIKTSSALPLLQQVGVNPHSFTGDKPMTPRQLFETSSKYVVLISASRN